MQRWPRAILAGLLAGSACLGAVAWSSARQVSLRRLEIDDDTHIVARQFALRLHTGLEKHLIALEQMAAFFENSEEVLEEEFQSFAAATLRRTPLCFRITAVDPSFRVRWVRPPEPNRALVGFDVREHALGYETVLRAARTREAVLSPPLELVGGAPGFILAAPGFRGDRFLGLAVCSVRTQDFFSSIVLPEILERYEEEVQDAGASVFMTPSFATAETVFEPQTEGFTLGGRTWVVHVRPRGEIASAQLARGQRTIWFLGWLLSMALGCVAGAGTYWASEIATRLRSQGKALRETRERLDGAMQQLLQAEKLSALGELVAGVAHEINNPLAAILGYSQLALARDLPPDVRRRLETVVSEAQRTGRIVRNLLTFARKHPPEKKYLGLNGIIDKTLELKAYHFRVNQIRLEKDLSPDLPKTMLDFQQVQQVLLNLLNNAEQAIAEQGRGGTIRLETRVRGDRIEARVTDTGPGIPAEIQRRIFEPFFTTKKEGKGTGLGLSLCYGIIQEHSGVIAVESEVGRGTTFVIDLPVVQDDGTTADAAQNASAPTVPTSKLRIFVVDDEPNVQGFLVDLLGSRGWTVDTASDIPEALKKLGANEYDMVITDMKMPHGTGRDIYRAVAERNPELAKRIIFTTGDGASSETQEFVRQMGNEILLKPFSLETIERAIAAAVHS